MGRAPPSGMEREWRERQRRGFRVLYGIATRLLQLHSGGETCPNFLCHMGDNLDLERFAGVLYVRSRGEAVRDFVFVNHQMLGTESKIGQKALIGRYINIV